MLIEKENPLTGELRKREVNITEDQLRAIKRGARPENVAPGLTAAERMWIDRGMTLQEAAELEGQIAMDGMGLTPRNPTDGRLQDGELPEGQRPLKNPL